MRRLGRTLAILVRFVPFAVSFMRDRRSLLIVGRPAPRSPEHHQRRAELLSARLAQFGPAFIKIAQLLSARADILPEPYLSEIGKLQDRVPADPTDAVRRVIESELGAPVTELFQTFEDQPLAAASLGQVHRASVDGRDLVVKVLRPGVEKVVALDLAISFRFLFWLNILFPNHHVRALTNVVREFSVRVRQEMDFRQEAANIERFQAFFARDPNVRAPEVVDGFTTR
ncbi:MAG: ABC1 kinase family protein, partial [Longimicrobiales bacterium]